MFQWWLIQGIGFQITLLDKFPHNTLPPKKKKIQKYRENNVTDCIQANAVYLVDQTAKDAGLADSAGQQVVAKIEDKAIKEQLTQNTMEFTEIGVTLIVHSCRAL